MVGQGLDRAGVDSTGHVLLCHGDGVLGNHGLSGRGVSRNKYAFGTLQYDIRPSGDVDETEKQKSEKSAKSVQNMTNDTAARDGETH